jgi:uncharacterized protein YbjT (DUF2867 family)
VRELRAKSAPVRAFVRDPDKAAARLDAGVEVSVGDFEDQVSLRRAMKGIAAVFVTSSNGPREVEHENAVINAAVEAGVNRIVKLSTFMAETGSPLPGMDWHGQIEQHLRQCGTPAVILQSAFFMSNMFASAEAIKQTGKLFAPAGDGGIAMIDPRDVAACAAELLTGDGHEGRTYLITGPEAVTHKQVAAALAKATGRPVEYVNVPPEAARQSFVEAGMPDWLIQHLTGVFGLIREGKFEKTTDTVRALTGRKPRTFAQFARDHSAAFKP